MTESKRDYSNLGSTKPSELTQEELKEFAEYWNSKIDEIMSLRQDLVGGKDSKE